MKQLAIAVWEGLVALVYPKSCIGCRQNLLSQERVLCLACSIDLPYTHYHHISENETTARFAGRLQFVRATSLFYLVKDGTVEALLHQFKYNNNKPIGVWMAVKLASALKKTDWATGIDYIIPIPLHHKKQSKRGFNQSEIIAQELSSQLSIALLNTAVKRVLNTDSQTTKSRMQRSENLRNAFQLNIDSGKLVGKHVLLLDDVLTTGATIEACALVLAQIPDLKISIATIGIAT